VPKIVDHDQRRGELARAALRVIGRGGLDAATTRAVAIESGWSTGVLKHYFSGKGELLHEALRELERRNLERFDAANHAHSGLEAIKTAFRSILGADPAETRVWLAFMTSAGLKRTTARTMTRAIDVWVTRWAALVVRGQNDGSIRSDLDPRQIAVELHALTNGLRTGAMLRAPSRAPPRSASGSSIHEPILIQALSPRGSTRSSGSRRNSE
jgi:AcrR family transcriptional regulator